MQHDLTPVPGSELRQKRLDAGAEVNAIAAALHCSRTTVWRMEAADRVPYIRARRYLDALREVASAETTGNVA